MIRYAVTQLVVLVVLGGSLLVAEQMRNDASRIEELEEAVASLAETLSPLLESPARRREVVGETARVRRTETNADEREAASTVRLVTANEGRGTRNGRRRRTSNR